MAIRVDNEETAACCSDGVVLDNHIVSSRPWNDSHQEFSHKIQYNKISFAGDFVNYLSTYLFLYTYLDLLIYLHMPKLYLRRILQKKTFRILFRQIHGWLVLCKKS